MKFEYIEKALSHLEGIENSNKQIQKMLEGEAPANQENALTLTKKIDRLLQLTRNLIK
jgi:hypothetical protein|tara:strand:- start:2398 stop:2571 length:174 start_codon:yes stop_codon:yes gene_type:complete